MSYDEIEQQIKAALAASTAADRRGDIEQANAHWREYIRLLDQRAAEKKLVQSAGAVVRT